MKVLKNISISRFFAQLIFILLPTALVITFILWNSNQYFSLLLEQWFTQACYFATGLSLSYFIFQFRFRFLPLFVSLLFVLFSLYKILDNYTIGEFDGFFISVQFLIFSYLFTFGCLVGWGLQRISFFPIVLSGILFLLSIFLISKTGEITVNKLLQYLSPIVLYTIYIIYTNESLRKIENTKGIFWWRFSKRLVLFCAFLMLIFGAVIYFLYNEINAGVEDFGGSAKEGENQMLQTKKDKSVKNRESMGLSGNNNRNKNPEPLFCAHIESYLPGTDIPNPLYLTSYHFTKFDTSTETFERDSLNKFNDEFLPDPSAIPLFFTYKDSSRILKALGTKNKKTIEIEVYKKRLFADAFIAPSTSFFVQPITVEKDFQKEFSSGYRAKSYVSDLNSAYFIYNTTNPEIVAFQQQRFDVLRKAKGYEDLDKEFMKYYTFFPANGQYRPVKELADSLAKGKRNTIDKVLAIRDYFLARNELGEQIYKYADNPGIPGLPGASKLLYFLFESKKGYCAYYAAATVFLLRSMNIPSRVVTGFLTVDRSDKNKGWYWYYEDQSHGWVQVYFPEFGWIDFDTTVGNEEAEQSPTPDGTPPMQPPNAVLAANGIITNIDTLKRTANLQIARFIFKDVEYEKIKQEKGLDLRIANIWKDSIKVPLSHLQKGSEVMVVSYAEKLKAYSPEKDGLALLNKLPTSLPIDEVYIKSKKDAQKKNEPNDKDAPIKPLTYYLLLGVYILLAILLLLFALPELFYQWYKIKRKMAKDHKENAYYTYKSASFLLNQLQVDRLNHTPLYFATNVVDKRFNTSFTEFMISYLKLKYANQELNASEQKMLQQFFLPFEQKIKSQFTFTKRLTYFLNLNQFIRYFHLSEPQNKS